MSAFASAAVAGAVHGVLFPEVNPLWAVCFIIGAALFGEALFDGPVAPKREQRLAQQCVGCGKYRPPHHPGCPEDRERIDLRRARQRSVA